MGTLYYGERRSRFPFLDILQRYLPGASVDLVYLDPPFHSAQKCIAIRAGAEMLRADVPTR